MRIKDRNELYYLDTSSGSLSVISINPNHKIWCYHKRLGHLSFSTLKVMLPLSFKTFDNGNLYRDICLLSKHCV